MQMIAIKAAMAAMLASTMVLASPLLLSRVANVNTSLQKDGTYAVLFNFFDNQSLGNYQEASRIKDCKAVLAQFLCHFCDI